MEYLTKQRSAGYQEKLYRAKRSFISSWQKGHQEARRDMRRNWLIFIIVLFWVVELIICLIVLLILNGIWTDQFSACQPDGTFSIVGTRDFSYWSSSGFFQISMGMGALTFSQAKAIDIVWDIVRFQPLCTSYRLVIRDWQVCKDLRAWRPITHRVHLLARLRTVLHCVDGAFADHIQYISYDILAKGIDNHRHCSIVARFRPTSTFTIEICHGLRHCDHALHLSISDYG